MRTKIKSNVQFFPFFFFKSEDIVMCTPHLLCAFTFMVDKFKSFEWVRKVILPRKKTIHGSFLHVLIHPFQESPAPLNEDTITVDC